MCEIKGSEGLQGFDLGKERALYLYRFTRERERERERAGKYKKEIRFCLVTVFVFYFQKLVFGNIKKKKFSCIFEIKIMFGQMKLKRYFFKEKKIENTKICCYQDLNSNANSLNETDLLN